ncbi:DUF1643 domain-containing protein [Methylocystis heyeri]|uniref:DUF1643 domain-containing protein n=1 Tax=Methylocystis heyeri TaxID=391905 RepID=A0A6B8KCZ9_9HYPH|nr:DUF1643 domain-containing protein [Methylocystis heyeri]QGM45579.1 DUF1643 domain-containing protein [Methylocystis heyeri]
MKKSATISACGRYRYELRRVWDESKRFVLFVCLNPSTADADQDDNTSRVCIKYAERWGYGGLLIGNLFAYRSVDKSVIKKVNDPIGPENDEWLRKLQDEASLIVCAWGDDGGYRMRDESVLSFIKAPHYLVRLNSGRPGHPLYKSQDIKPSIL